MPFAWRAGCETMLDYLPQPYLRKDGTTTIDLCFHLRDLVPGDTSRGLKHCQMGEIVTIDCLVRVTEKIL